MYKVIILFLFVISNGNAKDAPSVDIIKITATEEEIIIDGAQLQNIEGVSLRSLDKKIFKEYQVDTATGEKVTAHTIDARQLPFDKYLYLVVGKSEGEVFYPITLTSQSNKKVFYKISQKKKNKSGKKIEVDDKSEINFFPGLDFSGYDYDYSILTNSNGDLLIKGFDKTLFKLDQRGNLEIAGTLKVKGKTIVPYASPNSDLRISNVVIGEDNNISGVLNFTSSGNMDVATSTFRVDSATSRVGIGTSTPTYKLDIQGTTNSGIRLRQAAVATNTDTAFFNGMVFEDPSLNKFFGIGYGDGNLFTINSFDGTTYRNIFSLNNVGNGFVAGSLKIGTYTLPSAAGATGTILQSSGGGVVTWATPPQSVPSDGGVTDRILTSNGSNTPTWKNTLADIQFVDFSSTATVPAWKEGRLFYDSNTKALAYYNNSNGVSIDLGQEMVFLARNNTGSTIPDGSFVYITGAIGQRPTIALARANSVTTSRVIGATTQEIGNNSDGYVTNFGLVRGLDTSAFTEGDILYLSDTVAGAATNTAPSLPIPVGRVLYDNPSNGIIGVAPVIGAGNVFGPGNSVAGRPAIYSDTTGKALANTVPYTIPTVNGNAGQVLTSNGDGTTKWGTLTVAPTSASLPSDRKLKKEIKDLTESYIDKIMDLRPVSFVWKDTLNPDIGFIAQEVKKVFPYLVEEDAGYIGVNYQKMVVPLVKAVQEQQKEIERYKDAISRLEARIEKLESKASN